jgi:adenylate cyclase
MHIIIGEPNADFITERYTLLPLDRIRVAGSDGTHTAYCVLDKDNITVQDAFKIDEHVKLHEKLMENYYKKNWNFCEQALEHLLGSWQGSIDTFYSEISARVAKYKEQDPGEDWDGIIDKS